MTKTLYFGLEISQNWVQENPHAHIVHRPLITIQKYPVTHSQIALAFSKFDECTHLLFTSKTAVNLFLEACEHYKLTKSHLANKIIVAVGKATTNTIEMMGLQVTLRAHEECSEGIVALLTPLNLSHASFFWPRSQLSRSVISNFLAGRNIPLQSPVLYTTIHNTTFIDELAKELSDAEELVFTSPSSVDAFLHFFKAIPWDKKISAIGPVTHAHLRKEN